MAFELNNRPDRPHPMRWRMAYKMAAAWTAGGVILFLIAPNAGPAVLILSLVAPLVWLWGNARHLRPFQARHLNILFAVTAAYLAVNASWSPAPDDAYRSVAMFIITVIVLNVGFSALAE